MYLVYIYETDLHEPQVDDSCPYRERPFTLSSRFAFPLNYLTLFALVWAGRILSGLQSTFCSTRRRETPSRAMFQPVNL